jgi:hypothetical protein
MRGNSRSLGDSGLEIAPVRAVFVYFYDFLSESGRFPLLPFTPSLHYAKVMTFESKLAPIEKAYQDADGENRGETALALVALHKDLLRNGKDELPAFAKAACVACGGIYIPYLFWIALEGFLKDRVDRTEVQALLKAFAEGNFEQEDQALMKPLIVVYFSKEKEFELDRVRARLVEPAHPSVKEYLTKLLAFPGVNKAATKTFREKFALIGGYFPNFDLYNQTVGDIEERLKK